MMLTHADLFRPLDLRHRIFSKVVVPTGRDRLLALAPVPDVPVVNQIGGHVRLRELSFDAAPVAQLTVDAAGNLAMANQQMRTAFGVTARDLGRPLQDLEASYRPVELRALLDDAYAQRQAVAVTAVVRHRSSAPDQYFDIRVAPLFGNAGAVLGATVTFIDVTDSNSLREQLEASNASLEAAYEELQSSNEELETTNEELQSTNEELETTNEELQSTNEELETMNEELQSSNEELQTVNDELRERTYDLRRAHANLQGILLGLHDCVIVVDRSLKVLIWNPVAEDLWGLRAEEVVGRNLMELDFGLPVAQIPLAPVLAGKTDREFTELDAVNRRGKVIHCLVSSRLFAGDEEEFRGVLLIVTEVDR
jgi:two-component system CheB/CheR fusion protein